MQSPIYKVQYTEVGAVLLSLVLEYLFSENKYYIFSILSQNVSLEKNSVYFFQ